MAPSESDLFLVPGGEEKGKVMRKFWATIVTILILTVGWPVAEDGFIGSAVFVGTLCILAFWWWAEFKFK